MASFADFKTELESELKDLIQKSWKAVSGQATSDAEDFVKDSGADLQRWTAALANHTLTEQDFEFLLAAKKDVAELAALKEAGLAQVQLDRFLNGVIGAIINAASKTFVA
jgi:hypothetical protein